MTLVMGTIFILSHQSGDSLSLPSFPGADKLAHMIAYGVLAATVLWSCGSRALEKPARYSLLTVFCCLLYGMSDEYHQSFVALRSVSGYDLLADVAGATCFSLTWLNSSALRQRMVRYQTRLLSLLLPGS